MHENDACGHSSMYSSITNNPVLTVTSCAPSISGLAPFIIASTLSAVNSSGGVDIYTPMTSITTADKENMSIVIISGNSPIANTTTTNVTSISATKREENSLPPIQHSALISP